MKRRIVMVTAAGLLILGMFVFNLRYRQYYEEDYFEEGYGDPGDTEYQSIILPITVDEGVEVPVAASTFIWQGDEISAYLAKIRLTYSEVLISVSTNKLLEGSVTFVFDDGYSETMEFDAISGTYRIKLHRTDGVVSRFSASMDESVHRLGNIISLEGAGFERLSANTFRASKSMHALFFDIQGAVVDEVTVKKREVVTTDSRARFYREVF